MPNDVILETRDLTMRFGGLLAVSDFSVSIARGSITGLIGPNGAGKTTCFNMITGFYRPTSGEVLFEGRPIGGLPPHKVCKAGVARTFQNIRLFTNETVLENVMIGRHLRQKTGWLQTLVFTPASTREDRAIRSHCLELLDVVGLADLAGEKASSLSYGAQRRLEIARALATGPSFLLLDEPAAGMNPQESEDLMGFVRAIRDDFKLTVLLIEHDMKVVMGICEHIFVLDYGQIIAAGPPEAIRNDPKVILAYLGEEDLHA
ncbi:Sulfate-transporting ATPase [Solidesulfovibrio carbinoliphilus subsp. oakridgensis]|uniref:Sulfate-transporting ATPase n=1 Tax=Solidesulfovibrio carbinoliphilus subsp. oakridgensis TaxID=694327 RepID=G7Q6K6_9BACT|nr:ABC transporter ATP-binding protein [Solidesulfovibrio carbinoliphilus]EHJ47619.1 Sulfate-transporting ATPase [Solidesulfovibrio carbinoliphilus subsp. oakridgensis]